MALIAVRPLADPAADAEVARLRLVALTRDHPVLHRVVRVDLPVEQLRVIRVELVSVLPDDLEVDYRPAHAGSFRG